MCAAAPPLHATTRPPRRRRRRRPTCMQPLDRRGGGSTPHACNRAPPNLLYVHVLTISQSFAITMEMQKTHYGYRYRMDRVLVGGHTSFRCIHRNFYGRMKVNATGEIVSLTEHRHEPEYAEKHPPECPVSMKHAMKIVVPFNTVAKPRVDVNRFTDKVDIEGKDSEFGNRYTAGDEKDKLYSSSSFSNIIPTVDVEDKAVKDKDNCNIELLVLDTVPKRCKSQAAKILSYIKKHSDITWSPKGELTLKGSVLPNTHMVDLINALLRKRISKPSGWKQFATVLKDTKIPHKLVTNAECWKYINSLHERGDRIIHLNTSKQLKNRLHVWEPY